MPSKKRIQKERVSEVDAALNDFIEDMDRNPDDYRSFVFPGLDFSEVEMFDVMCDPETGDKWMVLLIDEGTESVIAKRTDIDPEAVGMEEGRYHSLED